MIRRGLRRGAALGLLALALLAWLMLAPIQFGGRTSYVIVSGISMEPLYQRGDLVLLRAAADYQIGDIATYRHPQVGPVIHRIIGRDGAHFRFKGDNNSWIDAYQPDEAELLGRAWLHLPGVGQVLARLRAPTQLAGLALIGALVVLSPLLQRPGPRRRSRRPPQAQAQGLRLMSTADDQRISLCVALGIVAAAALLLAILAWTRPAARSVPYELPYELRGSFRYTAEAPAGVYDDNRPQPGAPLFRELTTTVPVEFGYQLVSEEAASLSGSYRVRVEVGDGNGWQRTVTQQPAQSFSGAAVSTTLVIDLRQVQALIDSFEARTAISRPEYIVSVVPEVTVAGTLAGHSLSDSFAPRLDFRLDQHLLRPVSPANASGDSFKPVKAGSLSGARLVPNTITLLGLSVSVAALRYAALLTLLLTLAALFALGWPLLLALRRDETLRIRLKWGGLLVTVRDSGLSASQALVQVATIDDLARLAERLGSMILVERGDGSQRYIVHDGSVTYCYQPAVTPAPSEIEQRPDASWQTTFLSALCEKGAVAEACAAANIWLSTAYHERERSAAFAWAWDHVCHGRSEQPPEPGV